MKVMNFSVDQQSHGNKTRSQKCIQTYSEGKYVVTERFKQKNLQTMTAMSKNIYIDKLDNAVDEYNRP